MDIDKLRGFCDACLPEQWKAIEGANRSKVISGNAQVVQGHQMDVNAIVAFANAMPELLDTIERQAKDATLNQSKLRGAHDAMDALAKALTKTEQERDAALAEVERLQKEVER